MNRCTLANSWWCGIDPPPESATGAFALSSLRVLAHSSPFSLAFFFDSSSSCCLGGNGSFHRGHPLFASVFQLSSSKDFSRERIVTFYSFVQDVSIYLVVFLFFLNRVFKPLFIGIVGDSSFSSGGRRGKFSFLRKDERSWHISISKIQHGNGRLFSWK